MGESSAYYSKMTVLDKNFYYAYIVGYATISILHTIGLWLLKTTKTPLKNQRIVTMNLAVAELLGSLYQFVMKIYDLRSGEHHEHFEYLIDACFSIFLFTNIRLVMLHMIVDRFLDIYLNIKYEVYITKHRTTLIVEGLWITSALFAVLMTLLCHFVTGFQFLIKFFSYAFFSLDAVNALVAILVHVYLFVTVWSIAKTEFIHLPKLTQDRAKKTMMLKLLVPCLIIATYVLFNVSAEGIIIVVFHHKHGLEMLHNIAHLLIILGWISDVFICVFAQKNIRKRLLKMCRFNSSNASSQSYIQRNKKGTDSIALQSVHEDV